MIKERLLNWSAWAKVHKIIPVSCRSLESRYKSPQCWNVPEPKIFVDILDAIIIEKHLVRLPRREMMIIVYNYITPHRNFDQFCAKNKIRGSKELNKSQQFELDLQRAQNILCNAIDISNRKDYKHTNTIYFPEAYSLLSSA